MMDDRWRDSYDTWKLASPYDDWHEPDDPEPDYDAEFDFESLLSTYR